MGDKFQEFSRSVLIRNLYFTIITSNRHVKDLHIKLRNLVNQGLKVFKLYRTNQNTDSILVWLKIMLRALVINLRVDDTIKCYQSESVNTGWIELRATDYLTNYLQILV